MPRTAEWIDAAAIRAEMDLRTAVGAAGVLDDLEEIYDECGVPDWDGHGAHPVTEEHRGAVYRLLTTILIGFEPTSIGADPDGQISLEWYKTPNNVLSVSIDPDSGLLHYAGRFGPNRHHGSIVYYDSFPEELLRLIQKI